MNNIQNTKQYNLKIQNITIQKYKQYNLYKKKYRLRTYTVYIKLKTVQGDKTQISVEYEGKR